MVVLELNNFLLFWRAIFLSCEMFIRLIFHLPCLLSELGICNCMTILNIEWHLDRIIVWLWCFGKFSKAFRWNIRKNFSSESFHFYLNVIFAVIDFILPLHFDMDSLLNLKYLSYNYSSILNMVYNEAQVYCIILVL